MEKSKINIAIDGVAGSGKGTYSKILAKILGYNYLEAGFLYRVLTNYFLKNNITTDNIKDDFENIINTIKIEIIDNQYYLNSKIIEKSELRTPTLNKWVAEFGKIEKLKDYIINIQKDIVKNTKGIIAEGRNMANDVMPDADLKIYVWANPTVRANRRRNQYESYKNVSQEDAILEINNRDEIDFNHKRPLIRPTLAYDLYDVTINTSKDNPQDNFAKFIGALPMNLQIEIYKNNFNKIEDFLKNRDF